MTPTKVYKCLVDAQLLSVEKKKNFSVGTLCTSLASTATQRVQYPE
jgi:hypothetical protein